MIVEKFELSPSGRARENSWVMSTGGHRVVVVQMWFLGAVVISLLISWHFFPGFIDDALISLRYSDRLLHGHGLTWNDNEFVEGYSNLLWVLLIAAGGWLQPDLISVARVLSVVANVATLAAIPWAFGRNTNGWAPAVLGGLLLICCSDSFAFWGIGGMETALVCALLSWALAVSHREPTPRLSGVELGGALLFGLLAITRPDGILFGVGTGVGELLRSGFTRSALRKSLSFVVAPAAFMATQTGFRLAYYGVFVPNTASAKLAFSFERIVAGAEYVAQGALVYGAVFMTMAIGIVVLWKSLRWEVLRRNAVFLVPGIAWLAYICGVGGDWFPFERQWQPAFVCFTFAASGILSLLPQIKGRWVLPFAAAVVLTHIASQAIGKPYLTRWPQIEGFMQTMREELHRADASGAAERQLASLVEGSRDDMRRQLQLDYFQCHAMGVMLETAFARQQPLLAVNAAGCLPYFSKLPSVDMLGLNDLHIARHRPPDMGSGLLGHELGDGAYVLARKPDLVVFCGTGEMYGVTVPCTRSDRELAALPEFKKFYRLVFYREGEFEMPIWTRIEDGRLGIVRTENEIDIPGFLLATTPGVRGVLNAEDTPVAKLERGEARIEDVVLPPGTWEVSLKTDPQSHLQLTTSPGSRSTSEGPHTLKIISAGEARTFSASGDKGAIYAIVARRM